MAILEAFALKAVLGGLKKYWPLVLVGLCAAALTAFVYSKELKIVSLEQALAETAYDLEVMTKQRDGLRESVNHQNMAIAHWVEQAQSFKMEVDRLTLRQPEKLVEYREVAREVERVVVSPECVDAIAEAASLIRELRPNEK